MQADAEAFKLALSLLAPEGPSRGLRLLNKAFQAIQDRADLAGRENFELREELARLKQEKGAGVPGDGRLSAWALLPLGLNAIWVFASRWCGFVFFKISGRWPGRDHDGRYL